MKGVNVMSKWEKDMIAGVNRNAEFREWERRMKGISKRRHKKGAKK